MYRQCNKKKTIHEIQCIGNAAEKITLHLDVLVAPTDSPARDLIKGSVLAVIRGTVNITILVSLGKSISTAFRQHPPRPVASDLIAKQQQQATSSAPPQCRWHTNPCVTNITMRQVSLRRTHLVKLSIIKTQD
jgi:hypothetical protein